VVIANAWLPFLRAGELNDFFDPWFLGKIMRRKKCDYLN
jgi:hypothetical protein